MTTTKHTTDAGTDGVNPLKESTLELYGQSFPIGVDRGDGGLAKAFAFDRIDYEFEERLDRARNRKGGPGNHPAKIATEVLASVLTEFGGDTEFATKNHKHKVAAIEGAYMEDVLYAWVCLRVETMGADLAIRWECVGCEHEWTWSTDLKGLEVTVLDTPPKPKTVGLIYPVSWGDQIIDTVELLPAKWRAVCQTKNAQRRGTLGDIKAGLVRSAVRSVRTKAGVELPLAPRIFELIHKLDRERMAQVMDSKEFPRCDLTFEIECPECAFVQRTPLDWTWDFFFGSASLPRV